ncbi:DUF3558 domain-containing protein [Streptomyces sp. NPDC060194]|uniref:DUF3558 domain-containing protein n=1 Tax=Streptomyces sp. NPDC060194 TaxID=3347069 RepID=UPI00365FE329
MHRSSARITRILAAAAVPAILVVSGCSSDSGSDAKSESSAPRSAEASAKPSQQPEVAEATYAELPEPCKAVGKKTIEDLVPGAKDKSGDAGKSSDVSSRGSCAWNGLDDKGVDGSQYRWLDVSFQRWESDQQLGSGDQQAAAKYEDQVGAAKGAEGAKAVKSEAVNGIGDAATVVTYDLSKTGETFKFAVVVARTGNVIVTLDYNGAGYAGAEAPKADTIRKDAEKAAKEAVAAVGKANGGKSAEPGDKASGSPKASAAAAE